MKPLAMVGLVLIGLGIAGLAIGHFSFTTEKKVLDVGPLKATVDEKHDIAFPDIAGIGVIIAGALLLVIGMKKNA